MRAEPRSVADRLTRLERQNRRLRLAVIGGVLAVTAAGTMGFTALQDQVVWGKRFVLVDDSGRRRAELATGDNGAPTLVFFDSGERPRTEIGTFGSGNGVLRFREADGSIRLQASLSNEGPSVRLYDGDETRVVEVEVTEDAAARIRLNDDEGNARVTVSGGDDPTVQVLDPDGDVTWEAGGSH